MIKDYVEKALKITNEEVEYGFKELTVAAVEAIKSAFESLEKENEQKQKLLSAREIEVLVHTEKIINLEAELKNLAKFLNLCDYCKKEFANCDSQTNGLEWGTGKGNDNVVKCVAFEGGRNLYEEINRLKAESKSRYEHKKECEDMEGCH